MTIDNNYGSILDAGLSFQGILRFVFMGHRDGIPKTQVMVLHTLEIESPVSMSTLGRRLTLPKEQTTRLVQALVEKGYVERKRNEQNRRIVNVSITDAGKKYIQSQMDESRENLEDKLNALSDEEKAELVQISTRAAFLLKKTIQ